ncbi:MAG: GntR family transcriptional regulator, N-acetylglucosamine utilization regulator [Actinomycetota bacterium]|nr:GntR family transcriptional regulator, N-acetylglucosamine utilization regulator [Actinomycetota bacterium]
MRAMGGKTVSAVDEVFASAPDLAQESPLPAHVRIEHWLTSVIGGGDLSPGSKLPREEQLAATLGVSRMTLRQSLATLEGLGTIVRKPGRLGGTFVAEPKIVCDLTGLAGFTEQMRRAHVRAGARVVSASTTTAGRTAARALGLDRGGLVHEIVRVRSANREPLALEQACFPAALFPDLLEHRLTGSLYSLLTKSYDHAPHTATEFLEPVIAGPEEAALLSVEQGSPLMLIERTAFTASGVAVEFARDVFRADRTRITIRTGLGPSARSQLAADGQVPSSG